MILGFKTKTDDGKPTLFPEKVLQCLMSQVWIKVVDWHEIMKDSPYGQMAVGTFTPKLHSMREGIHDRWKPGVMIDFYTGVRTKKAYRFAPRVPVVSVQKVEIKQVDVLEIGFGYLDTDGRVLTVEVDGKILSVNKIRKLSYNDGFMSLHEFFGWFQDGWKGKIIHWTNLRY
jgi:hypothetical protein